MVTATAPPLNFVSTGIGSILKKTRLNVPPNQREYSWEEKHVTDLLQDLENAIDKKKPVYFLGTIVVSKGAKNIPEVVDGQQRLATTSIILATIRDYFIEKNENQLRDSIDYEFLFTYDRERKEKVPNLSLNVDDNEYFRNRIIAWPEAPERIATQVQKESHKRINYAAQIAKNKIQNIIRGHTDRNATDLLNEWIDYIDHKAIVILVTVPDEMNAFMMFETLNDRGLKTSQADLLKNYLFREAEDRLQEAQSKWSNMVSRLEPLGIEDIVMTYLRHMAITQFGPTREKEMFNKIQSDIAGRTQSIIFLGKLAEYADSYNALLTPTVHPKWNAYKNQTREYLTVLSELRVQQIRPLMLAVAQHFSPKEAEMAFRSFVFWTVRFLIVGGMRGGQLEEAYGLRAVDITKGKISTTKNLLEALQDVIPSDTEFKEAFSAARVSQHYLARYYLRAIESFMRGEDDVPELAPVRDTNILNLEHILPLEPGNNWSHIDAHAASAYVNRIGNMTLMKSKQNTEIANVAFKIKWAEFKRSQLLLNKQLCEMTTKNTKWGLSEINARQGKLAEYAMKTWPLS